MLEKFKSQARTAVNKKQRELNALLKLKSEHDEQMAKIRAKVKDRKIKQFFSDESESEDEDIPFPTKPEATMAEYTFVKH